MDIMKSYVTYEEFGAKGDGITDDMPAIVACHEYANANKLDVVGRDGANYYIGGKDMTAVIKTNVHWGKAKFTIDDRELENIRQSCFHVCADEKQMNLNISSLYRGQKNVDIGRDGCFFVRVFNENKRVYIRKGLNKNDGTAASDSFVVDRDGTVIGDINWDYDVITSARAVRIDEESIVIEGGIFTTIANVAPSFYNYHSRNIHITRSNVTVKDITYLVTGEGTHGAPYSGFLSIEGCYNVTLKDCLLTPHFTYRTESKIPGKDVPMGTYSINISSAIGVKLINIKQTIDIADKRYWGLMGSNFSKNFYMENCEISRYDAHMGVTNCVIKNCKLGYMGTNLIGFGECIIENTTFVSSRTVELRPDYGSSFHGKLTMRNCTWIPLGGERKETLYMLTASNTGDHNFGYYCSMPEEIEIDGLVIEDEHIENDSLSYVIFPNYDPDYAENKPFAYGIPKSVILKGIYSKKGRAIAVFKNAELYPDIGECKITE